MANTDALITISEITDGIMFKSKLRKGEEIRIKQMLLDGFRELNITTLPYGRVQVLLEMDENYVLDMPLDLESLKDIYVPIDGKVWSLTRNTDIPMILTDTGEIPDGWGSGSDVWKHGIYYGSKGGQNLEGYYIEDYVNRRFIFRNIDRSEVLLDYNSSGIVQGDSTYIPTSVKAALEMYVMMQMALFGVGGVKPNMFSLYEKEFNKQKGILRAKDFNFTAFIDTVYETITSGVRR